MEQYKDLDFNLVYGGLENREGYYKRKVKLNDYLPQVIGGASEIAEMNAIEDDEFEVLWDFSEKQFYNRWILSADELGLKRYETLLGINGEGDLEDRRQNVWYEWNKYVKYTDRSLRALLDLRCGSRGYYMNIYYSRYVVRFEARIKNSMVDLRDIRRELRLIIPANMGIEIGVFAEYEIILRSEFESWPHPYNFTGNLICGDGTKGIIVEDDVIIRTDMDIRTNSPLYAGNETLYYQEPIYAVIERPEVIYVIDASEVYFNNEHDIVMQSGGYF